MPQPQSCRGCRAHGSSEAGGESRENLDTCARRSMNDMDILKVSKQIYKLQRLLCTVIVILSNTRGRRPGIPGTN